MLVTVKVAALAPPVTRDTTRKRTVEAAGDAIDANELVDCLRA